MQAEYLGQDNPLEEEMATHSNIFDWRILWTKELGGLQSIGLQRVRYAWLNTQQAHILCICVHLNSLHEFGDLDINKDLKRAILQEWWVKPYYWGDRYLSFLSSLPLLLSCLVLFFLLPVSSSSLFWFFLFLFLFPFLPPVLTNINCCYIQLHVSFIQRLICPGTKAAI